MSIFFKASALVLFAFTALPFAACTGGTGGSTASGPCASYCQAIVDCSATTGCVFTDATSAEDACVSSCQTGLAALTAAESELVTTCFDCTFASADAGCPGSSPASTCATECNSAATTAAGNKWQAAVMAAPTTAAQCTNGMDPLSGGSCSGGGDTTSCTSSCCNGSGACATPDVALECSGTNLETCTCTAGKNKGKTVQATACSGDVWTLCNL